MAGIKDMRYSPYEIADIMERYACKVENASRHDYGTGEEYTRREVHTISYIGEYPGITITEFAKKWNKTKGAVSQMIIKLEKMGLVERVKLPGNDKAVTLYLTDKGKDLDKKHREYDYYGMLPILGALVAKHSLGEVEKAFEIVEDYTRFIEEL